MTELKFPTLEELGKQGGEWALDVFEYKGLTIRQWADKITTGEYQPVKHAYWEEKQDMYVDTYYHCTNCKEDFVLVEGTPKDNLYYYCPNCGAKMDGGGGAK